MPRRRCRRPSTARVTSRTQRTHGDRDEAVHRRPRREAARCGERAQAEARELLRRHVTPHGTDDRGTGEHIPYEIDEPTLDTRDVLRPVDERGDLTGVAFVVAAELVPLWPLTRPTASVPMGVGPVPARAVERDLGVRGEHGLEALTWVCGPVTRSGERLEVLLDVPLVPGDEDGLHVGEVLVERRPADAGLLGDPRHRHVGQAVLPDERGGRLDDGFAHLATMRVDRVRPESWHAVTIYHLRDTVA